MKLLFGKLLPYWYRLRRYYLLKRYRNLQMGFGTVVIGTFKLSGNGQVTLGSQCRLINVRLNVDGQLNVGTNVYLNGASVVCKQSVSVGDECLISDAYIVDTDYHNLEPRLRRAPLGSRVTRPIWIGRNVWIGDKGVVLKGSFIGDNSVIGSNSVIRGHIPGNVVCIGNPVVVVKTLKE